MKKYLLVLVLSGIGLTGCNPAVFASQDIPANTLNELKSKLTFTCVHEATSELSVEADIVFQYARWLQKSNQLKRDADVNIQIERLYRIAAEQHGSRRRTTDA